MPYQGETANKGSHRDIVKNPDVSQFLAQCQYLHEPSDAEVSNVISCFEDTPLMESVKLPEKIIAFDGSFYEASIDDKLPSTKIGYVKIGSILIDMDQFSQLKVGNGRLVDPFKVAELKKNNDVLTFSLPSANIRWKGKETVSEGFRLAIDEYLYGPNTRFNPNDPATSLRTTLFHLASMRSDLGTNDPNKLILFKCPNEDCNQEKIEIRNVTYQQYCPQCGDEIYPSDCLRLWEKVTDYQSNVAAFSNFMMAIEHLLSVHYIRYLADIQNSLSSLSSLAFFVDGPLALFDVASWLHNPIMSYLSLVNERLEKLNLPKLLIIGLQKTGQVVDHVGLIDRYIPTGKITTISDEYRYKYILLREKSKYGFGSSTYYGQDFIYKTLSGKTFVFALPYPFRSKSGNFANEKTKIENYAELARAVTLINHFETDLYKNAVVPIALAHRYTAISLIPGGRVLDLLTKNTLRQL